MLNLTPAVLITRIITLVIALSLHEFAHAFVADRLGDSTPRYAGRLSLNPLRHLDPIGSLMLVLVGFGWAKPVPIDPNALKRRTPAGVMWVSLAGPFTNFLLALLSAFFLRLNVLPSSSLSSFLPSPMDFFLEFTFINLALFLFNILPLAPLDGDKVIEFLLPVPWRDTFAKLRPYGPMVLILFVFILPRLGVDIFAQVFYAPLNALLRLLLGGMYY